MTTSVTAAQIAQIRRMVDEPTTATYSDDQITSLIEARATIDELGNDPYYWDTSTTTPTKVTTVGWVPTYDLNYAAGDIWAEKAAALAELFSFSADGANNQLSEKYDHAQSMARKYLSMRKAGSIKMMPV